MCMFYSSRGYNYRDDEDERTSWNKHWSRINLMSLSPAGLSFCLCARGRWMPHPPNTEPFDIHRARFPRRFTNVYRFFFFFLLCVSVCGLHWVISRVLLSCIPRLYRETNGGELITIQNKKKKDGIIKRRCWPISRSSTRKTLAFSDNWLFWPLYTGMNRSSK